MIFKKSFKNGFTLIEVLIYMAVLSIIMTVSTDIFVNVLKSKLETSAKSSLDYDGKYIMARLAYDISRSDNTVIPSSLGQTTNLLSLVINSENYTYQLVDGNLEVTASLATDYLNGNQVKVEDITFTRLGNENGKESIRVSLKIKSVATLQLGGKTMVFQSTFSRLR